jgi:hypothetical protein
VRPNHRQSAEPIVPLICFPRFTIDAPDGWSDVTNEVGTDGVPFTLARHDGVGALQFSFYEYRSGEIPDPASRDLLGMLEGFAGSNGFAELTRIELEDGHLRLAAGSVVSPEAHYRLWLLSDGSNILFATYTCETCAIDRQAAELPDCEKIVRSVRFLASRHK